MTIQRYLLGCDPEVFLHDGLDYVSAAGLFPGTKKEPFKVDKGAVQVDGLALEFNIDPASSAEEFNLNIETVLAQMNEMVKEVNPDLTIMFTPFARFDPTYFSVLDHESKVLGCDPDYDIAGNQTTPPEGMMHRPFRTAAGHMHVGWTEDQDKESPSHFEDCRYIANHFLGTKFYFPETIEELERVKYYGKPIAWRPKSYGVELRTPSNIWVAHKKTRLAMYNVTMRKLSEL